MANEGEFNQTVGIDVQMFTIGQCYDDKPATTQACKKCGCNTFNLGLGTYYTAVKCTECGLETCVHSG